MTKPVTITLRQAVELIEQASAVVFDHQALAWVNVDAEALESGDPGALWLDYRHEDEEGLCFDFQFDTREQDIVLRGSDIELLDAKGEPTTISLYTRWVPDLSESDKVAVGVLLTKPDGSGIWLSERLPKDPPTKFDGCFATPGGKVEPGEDLVGALLRETREETGLELTNVAYVVNGFFEGTNGTYQAYHYLSETAEEPQNLEPEKHGPWRFFTTEELDGLKLMDSTRLAVRAARALGWLRP